MKVLQFNQELLELQDKLKYFALSLTQDDDDANDLLQETTLKALTYRQKFVDNTNLKAWLFTIMKNTFINNYRKIQKNRNTFEKIDDVYSIAFKGSYNSETPENIHSVKEMEQKIELLEDDFKIPFTMHTSGFKYKEIADELDLPIGTVKSRIFFTRKKLQTMLSD